MTGPFTEGTDGRRAPKGGEGERVPEVLPVSRGRR